MTKLRTERVSFFAPAFLRRFCSAFLLVAMGLSVIFVAIYRQDVVHQRLMLGQEAQHVTALQEELLQFELAAVQSDIRFLASQEVLKIFLSGDTPSRNPLESEYASFATNKAVYDQIRCLDTTGQEIVRVNFRDQVAEIVPKERLQDKASRYYYQRSLSLDVGEVFISPFDLNVEHGEIQRPMKPVIRFVTPVFDRAGNKRGMLVLNYLGSRLLSKLRQLSSGFRGSTMLVNSAGEYLQAPDRDHEWGWLLRHKHNFRNQFPEAWDQHNRTGKSSFRVGESLFRFQRVLTDHGMSTGPQDPGSLMLVSYVSPAVSKAHSAQLLKQMALLSVGVMAVVAVLLLYWAHSGVVRRHHEQRIAASESRLRQLSSLLLAAQEEERRNLSRDLHDELGQQVTAIGLDLRSLEKKVGPVDSNSLLRRAIEETDELLKSLHSVATRVRPSVLDDLGLEDAIESYLSEFQQRTGIGVISQLRFDGAAIPGIVAENAFRILQEALANVAAHAQVCEVEVTMDVGDDTLDMIVHDSGVGFDVNDLELSTRLGVLGMRERVELLNGRFDLQTTRGEGTEIRVLIPLAEDPQ